MGRKADRERAHGQVGFRQNHPSCVWMAAARAALLRPFPEIIPKPRHGPRRGRRTRAHRDSRTTQGQDHQAQTSHQDRVSQQDHLAQMFQCFSVSMFQCKKRHTPHSLLLPAFTPILIIYSYLIHIYNKFIYNTQYKKKGEDGKTHTYLYNICTETLKR